MRRPHFGQNIDRGACNRKNMCNHFQLWSLPQHGATGRRGKSMRCVVARLAKWIALGLIGAALYDQLRRAPAERTWMGQIGPVPYDFRLPSLERLRASLWNPDDPRIITPMPWGIGWSVNLARAWLRLSPLVEQARQRLTTVLGGQGAATHQ